MEQSLFDQLAAEMANQQGPTAEPQQQQQAAQSAVAAPPHQPQGAAPTSEYEARLGDVSRLDQSGRVGGSIVAGAAESLFQTKDFLFGQTPEAEKSETRRGLETLNKRLKEESAGYGIVSGLSQFTTGILGAGKVIQAAKVIPGVASGLATGAAATGKAAGAIGGSAKAAAVGAVAFDPNGERLSNLFETYLPGLSNWGTRWMASKPGETRAEGRFKNALESLGFDAVVSASILAGLRGYKAVNGWRGSKATPAERAELDASLKGLAQEPEPGLGVTQPATPSREPDAFLNDIPGIGTGRHEVEGFHGSTAQFDQFDASKLGSNTGAPSAGKGFFFSRDSRTANAYTQQDLNAFGEQGADISKIRDPAARAKAEQELAEYTKQTEALRAAEVRGDDYWREMDEAYAIRDHARKSGDREAEVAAQADLERLRAEQEAHEKELKAWRVDDTRNGWNAMGVLSRTMEEAAGIGGNVRKVKLRMDNPFVHDFKGDEYREVSYSDLIDEAKRRGHDSAILRNTRDGGPNDDIYVVFKPDQIDNALGKTHSAPDHSGKPDTVGTPANDLEAPPPAPQGGPTLESVQQGATPGAPPARTPLVTVTDDQIKAITEGARADAAALEKYGSWAEAVENGHVFSKGDRTPWQKLASVDAAGQPEFTVDAFVQRVAEAVQADTSKARGAGSDKAFRRMVAQRAGLTGEDPNALLGLLAKAGKDAPALAANMHASFLIANKAMVDAFGIATRIRAGDIGEWAGNLVAAQDALRKQLEVAATAWTSGQAMRTSAGRALRSMRREFQISPEDLMNLQRLDPDKLVDAIVGSDGNLKAIRELTKPGKWARLQDPIQWALVNNLLSGPTTHLVNLGTSAHELLVRPAQRIVGSYLVHDQSAAPAIRAEAARQYISLYSSLRGATSNAIEAWLRNDSVMFPHSSENVTGGSPVAGRMKSTGEAVTLAEFKPFDSLTNIMWNAGLAGLKTWGVPLRGLGAADELLQQIVYRSKVQARAQVEGMESGLSGQGLRDHVSQRLEGAFDDAGRAIDADALREARTTMFQQDILPGTFGAGMQAMAQAFPPIRLIVPFIRTPTNVLRTSWKMTPGLNLLQSEFKAELGGALGPERQAQAVGQMAYGSLLFASAAMLAAEGKITGGGPSDPKAREALQATGWRPYSKVGIDSKGKPTYLSIGRFDPVATPLGLIADLVDIVGREENPSEAVQEATMAVFLGLMKAWGQKTFLRSFKDTIDMMSDPEERATKWAGRQAANYVVPLGRAVSWGESVASDPYLRDARTVLDTVRASIPGLAEGVPPKRDSWGEPILANRGLYVVGSDHVVDQEMRRMILEHNLNPPQGPNPVLDKSIDLRDITTQDGRNAYDVYQEYYRQPTKGTKVLKEAVADLIRSKGYQQAVDGDADLRGTRLNILGQLLGGYKDAAKALLLAKHPEIRKQVYERQQRVADEYIAKQAGPKPAASQAKGREIENFGRSLGIDLGFGR